MDNKKSSEFRIVKYAAGWASGGSGQTSVFGGKSTVIINGKDSFTLYKKNYEFIKYNKGIITPELIIFSMFSIFSLFFNILVHSFEQIPIPPKIICGIILTATATPIVFSLLKSPRRIIFKLNSDEFIALYFINSAEKKAFINCLAENNSKYTKEAGRPYGYNADVSFNMFDEVNRSNKSNAKIMVEDKRIKITVWGKEIFTDYYSKSHDLLWQLYPFASIFIIMPLFAIFSVLQSDSFDKGILFTLIFLVAGLIILFVPSIISRGQLLLLNREGYIRLSFVDSKTRRKFEQEIKAIKKNIKEIDNFSFKNSEKDLKNLKIFNIAKYKIPVGLLIATIIYIGIIVALVFSLDFFIIILGIYIGFIFYSFLYIFYKDIIRENFIIRLRRRLLEDSDLVMAEITDYLIKDFKKGRKYFFNVEITTKHIQNGEIKINKFHKKSLSGFPDYCIGQKVNLGVSGSLVSLLIDITKPINTVPKNELFFPRHKNNMDEKIIKELKSLAHNKVNTKKPYRILGQWRLRFIAYALSVLVVGGLVRLFAWITFSSSDSTTKKIGAVILSIMILLFALAVKIFIAYLMRFIHLKSIVKNGVLTKAYILHRHKTIREITSSSNNRVTVAYYFKFVYFDEYKELKAGYCQESFSSNFTGYGLPKIEENTFIDICVLNGNYAILHKFQAVKK